LLETSTAISKF